MTNDENVEGASESPKGEVVTSKPAMISAEEFAKDHSDPELKNTIRVSQGEWRDVDRQAEEIARGLYDNPTKADIERTKSFLLDEDR